MRAVAIIVIIAQFSAVYAGEKETPVESRIVSVGLFKNGLAVVKRTVTVPGPGAYVLRDVPEPVHGTFWIESDAAVETRLTTRDLLVPTTGADFQNELAGRRVTIHFRDGQIPPATGVVLPPEKPDRRTWDRAYEQTNDWRWYSHSASGSNRPAQPRYLVLQTEAGSAYIESSMIAYSQVDGPPKKVTKPQPVLLFTVGEVKEKPATINVSYLTKGIGWAASYRVDISNPRELFIEQHADVRNELEDITDAEVSLITGFPSIQFAHVASPLSARTTWANFFQQLSMDPSQGRGNRNLMSQQRVISNRYEPDAGIDLSAAPQGEGPDVHYQPIGRRTLAEGDCISAAVASGKAGYERIVEWIVPDTRDAQGRYMQNYERQQNADKEQDAAWDALRFRNPLKMPMTTGPAAIYSTGRFLGQRTSFYVSAGEETTQHVTKALSVRTRAVENEEQGEKRDIVWIGGNDYRKVSVKGELTASNHRAEEIKLVIRRRFSGDLVEAAGDPKVSLLEEGVYSVNRRNELVWSITLQPGKEETFTYRYTVLVWN